MIFWIAFGLSLVYCLLKPYSDGFLDTSLWLAKILAPPFPEDMPEAKLAVKYNQGAIMDGWPSNIPFFTTILGLTSLVLAFIDHWWMGLIMFGILGFGGGFMKAFTKPPANWYISLLIHRMSNRVSDYAKKGDIQRQEAARGLQEEMVKIYNMYMGTGLHVPTKKQIAANPYGKPDFLLNETQDFAPMSKEQFDELNRNMAKKMIQWQNDNPGQNITPKIAKAIRDIVFKEETDRINRSQL